ncbi:hypothetical protein SY88_14735 [Clostridiales bacterium PH28_bin88]|nr:hypothetical protein SY88_14735 [Clostridiales bacterium PH28_bin88]
MEFLSTYWPYLVFGGLMLLMMRHGGGCCGGHQHGGHGHGGQGGHGHQHEGDGKRDQDNRIAAGQARDPVCGMTVNKKEAVYKNYDGQEYYFCSDDCARTFNARHDRRAG